MAKIILVIIVVIIALLAAYYGRFLFTKKVVQEELPYKMEVSHKTLFQGTFQDIDFIHKGSGKALILEDSAGSKILRLEDFNVTNGPDLHVYLSPNAIITKDETSLGS